MGTRFSITDDAVNQHASNLDMSVAAMNSQAAQFITAIEPLPAVWRGQAFQSWDQLTARWNEAMAELNRALTDITSRVGNSGQLYDTYHQEQTSQLQATMGSANWDGARFRG